MPQSIGKIEFRRCRELRESAGLSMTRLAGDAGVSRDLLRTLESGKAHSSHKVNAVFNALQKHHNGLLVKRDELLRLPESGERADMDEERRGHAAAQG